MGSLSKVPFSKQMSNASIHSFAFLQSEVYVAKPIINCQSTHQVFTFTPFPYLKWWVSSIAQLTRLLFFLLFQRRSPSPSSLWPIPNSSHSFKSILLQENDRHNERDDCGWAEGARETRRDAEKTRHEKDNTNRSKIEGEEDWSRPHTGWTIEHEKGGDQRQRNGKKR